MFKSPCSCVKGFLRDLSLIGRVSNCHLEGSQFESGRSRFILKNNKTTQTKKQQNNTNKKTHTNTQIDIIIYIILNVFNQVNYINFYNYYFINNLIKFAFINFYTKNLISLIK